MASHIHNAHDSHASKTMGTRGYIVIKLGKCYYKIYNHWDSYPSHLGKKVKEFLKTLIQDGKLTPTQECVDLFLAYFNEEKYRNKLEEDLDEDAELTLMIEWIYRIDLDAMTLTVQGWETKQKFNLVATLDAFDCREDRVSLI